jgi:hypothetical protein
MGFTAHIFFLPAKKFTMNPKLLEKNKSPYDDMATEDMLRHFKLEYFLMTNALSFIITEVLLLSNRFYNIDCRGTFTTNAKILLICCMIPRILRYAYYSVAILKGNEWFEDNMKILNYGIGALSYAAGIYGFISLYNSALEEKKTKHYSNVVIHVWMKLEVTCLILEPTVLILLALTKPKPTEENKIVTTYGRLQSAAQNIDHDHIISEK